MVTVLIYEDNPQLREGLSMLINGTPGFEVVAAYKDCTEIKGQVPVWKPDVVLMDIDMPGMSGIDGLKKLRVFDTDTKVLMLTVFDDNQNVFDAIRFGANGYILKKHPRPNCSSISRKPARAVHP